MQELALRLGRLVRWLPRVGALYRILELREEQQSRSVEAARERVHPQRSAQLAAGIELADFKQIVRRAHLATYLPAYSRPALPARLAG